MPDLEPTNQPLAGHRALVTSSSRNLGAQIARTLEISPGAVKTHAHRGLTALRRTIDPLELS